MRRTKLLAPTPETLESLTPLHQLRGFLDSVARAEDMHDLGFHIAGQLGIESLGSYGQAAAKAFTFHESILFDREMTVREHLSWRRLLLMKRLNNWNRSSSHRLSIRTSTCTSLTRSSGPALAHYSAALANTTSHFLDYFKRPDSELLSDCYKIVGYHFRRLPAC